MNEWINVKKYIQLAVGVVVVVATVIVAAVEKHPSIEKVMLLTTAKGQQTSKGIRVLLSGPANSPHTVYTPRIVSHLSPS